jgi:hypothetical protein
VREIYQEAIRHARELAAGRTWQQRLAGAVLTGLVSGFHATAR